jgi:hypothetical protein
VETLQMRCNGCAQQRVGTCSSTTLRRQTGGSRRKARSKAGK